MTCSNNDDGVTKTTFPSATDVHLNSHPCEPDVLWRWHDSTTIIWLARRYAEYKNRWANNRDAVQIANECRSPSSTAAPLAKS
jgi:hypothetical protein